MSNLAVQQVALPFESISSARQHLSHALWMLFIEGENFILQSMNSGALELSLLIPRLCHDSSADYYTSP